MLILLIVGTVGICMIVCEYSRQAEVGRRAVVASRDTL